MSTFSGFTTGLSGLLSHQRALEVASNNIANLNTVGYTRQRAELGSVDAAGRAGMHASASGHDGGVRVTSVQRLGDVHLEARLREHSAEAGKLGAVHEAWAAVEGTVTEPSDQGLSEKISGFFNAWSDLGNQPQSVAAKAVLVEDAKALAGMIRTAHTHVSTAWQDMRTKVVGLVEEVNVAASTIAELNDRILTAETQGAPTGTLVDKRNDLLVELARAIGATSRARDNGSVDVFVGGTSIVAGKNASPLGVEGALTHQVAAQVPTAENPLTAHTGPVRIVWPASGSPLEVTSGRIGGYLEGLDVSATDAATPTPDELFTAKRISAETRDALTAQLASGDAAGTAARDTLASLGDKQGALPSMGMRYDRLAVDLATTVNRILSVGNPVANGRPFFSYDPGSPASSLRVEATVDSFSVASSGEGAFGNALADEINRAGLGRGGVSDKFSSDVVDVGVQVRSATRRADAAEDSRATTENQLTAATGVNLDEEVMTLMAAQNAYAGAARVISTLDRMFDTLLAMGAR